MSNVLARSEIGKMLETLATGVSVRDAEIATRLSKVTIRAYVRDLGSVAGGLAINNNNPARFALPEEMICFYVPVPSAADVADDSLVKVDLHPASGSAIIGRLREQDSDVARRRVVRSIELRHAPSARDRLDIVDACLAAAKMTSPALRAFAAMQCKQNAFALGLADLMCLIHNTVGPDAPFYRADVLGRPWTMTDVVDHLVPALIAKTGKKAHFVPI